MSLNSNLSMWVQIFLPHPVLSFCVYFFQYKQILVSRYSKPLYIQNILHGQGPKRCISLSNVSLKPHFASCLLGNLILIFYPATPQSSTSNCIPTIPMYPKHSAIHLVKVFWALGHFRPLLHKPKSVRGIMALIAFR